ncbi:hypothetical protein BDR04DRAFT_1159670 [Suillus decipiens]|nr:hypothetical protein BDR04DRAFT_1159670 [Suillus decipiens]
MAKRTIFFDIEYSEPNSEPHERSILMAILSPLMLKPAEVYADEVSLRDNFSLARWRKFGGYHCIRDFNLLHEHLRFDNWQSGFKHIGSIIIGLIIFKQYRAKGTDTPVRAILILKRISANNMVLRGLLLPAAHLTSC